MATGSARSEPAGCRASRRPEHTGALEKPRETTYCERPVSDNAGIGLHRPGDLARLRTGVRAAADRLGLSTTETARIVLAASQTGRAALRHGRIPRAAVRTRHQHGEKVLAVEFVAVDHAVPLPVPDPPPPVTAIHDPGGAVRVELRLRADRAVGRAASNRRRRDELRETEEAPCTDDALALEGELRAALADADDRVGQVRRLNDELEETKIGRAHV